VSSRFLPTAALRFARGLVALLVVLAAALSPAWARSLTEAETAALADTVADFDAAMREGDYAAIVEVLPPRMLENIARQAGVPADELLVALKGQMDEIFASVELISFGMDVAAAEEHELPDGSPYALLPTTTVMEAEGLGRVRVESKTLGLLDDSTWYLVRVSDAAMVGVLRQVYPEFTGVEFPAETMTAVEE
jgi:hypothetical protein